MSMMKTIKSIVRHMTNRRFLSFVFRYFGHNRFRGLKGNIVSFEDSILSHCSILFHGSGNVVRFGGGNRLVNCKIDVYGNDCMINIGSNGYFCNDNFRLEDDRTKILVGDNVKMCGAVHMGIVEGTTLTIGNGCLFSSDISITTTDSHSILNLETGQRINPSADVIIGNHVWVGQKAIICKGVRLVDDIVVGRCALVTKSVTQSHVAIAGIPAKVVREGITWDHKRI